MVSDEFSEKNVNEISLKKRIRKLIIILLNPVDRPCWPWYRIPYVIIVTKSISNEWLMGSVISMSMNSPLICSKWIFSGTAENGLEKEKRGNGILECAPPRRPPATRPVGIKYNKWVNKCLLWQYENTKKNESGHVIDSIYTISIN